MEEVHSLQFASRSGFNVRTSFFMKILRYDLLLSPYRIKTSWTFYVVEYLYRSNVRTKHLKVHLLIQIAKYIFSPYWKVRMNKATAAFSTKIWCTKVVKTVSSSRVLQFEPLIIFMFHFLLARLFQSLFSSCTSASPCPL